MARITHEQHDDLVILRVFGDLSFEEIIEAIQTYFPLVTRNLFWDFTEGRLDGVTPKQFRALPAIVIKHLPAGRTTGRTAYACPNANDYGMFRMYSAIADINALPYEYAVYRTLEDALEWVRNG